MLVNLIVESNFSAPANGYLRISIDNSNSVQSLIDKFCVEKGINIDPNYQLITQSNDPLSGKKSIEYYDIRNGDRLFLGDAGDFKPFRFTNWFAVAALAFLLGIAGIAICVSIYIFLREIPDSYAIVFDAGSTHTDSIVFKWPGSKINNTGLVTEVHDCYTKGGIASISPTETNISNYLNKCLDEARENIHPDSSEHTEVFFGGTAGMRLLQETNPSAAAEMMKAVNDYLDSSGFQFEDLHSQIMTGVKEGINGWITVNYLNRYLQSNKREVTKGALDLGGASTQISFEVDEQIENGNPFIESVRLYGKRFNVYCKSFLCYGTVQALIRYRSLLLKEYIRSNSNGKQISSPCDPIGRNTEVVVSKILDSPCSPASVRILHHISSRNTNETVVFVGTSDYEKCQSTVKYLLSQQFCDDSEIQPDKCINGTGLPQNFQQKKFTGFSGFAYARQNLNLTHPTSMGEFLNTTKRHCSSSLEEISRSVDLDKSKTLKNQQELCFKAVFVYNLLTEIYKFNTNSLWANIEFENEIENKTLGWALGYMINATESISTVPSIPSLDTLAFVLLVILFCVFVIIGLAFLFQALKIKRSNRLEATTISSPSFNC